MIENVQAIAPVIGVYLFLAACFCALIWAWIWWEDRNDDGGNHE